MDDAKKRTHSLFVKSLSKPSLCHLGGDNVSSKVHTVALYVNSWKFTGPKLGFRTCVLVLVCFDGEFCFWFYFCKYHQTHANERPQVVSSGAVRNGPSGSAILGDKGRDNARRKQHERGSRCTRNDCANCFDGSIRKRWKEIFRRISFLRKTCRNARLMYFFLSLRAKEDYVFNRFAKE